MASISGSAFAETTEKQFSFRENEYTEAAGRLGAAEDFVARQLPAGVPLQVALQRAKAADLDCGQQASGARVCRFSMVEGADGEDLGDSVWTVRLTPDAAGDLKSATVEHTGPSL
jgi:hypothetical protein